MAHKTLADLILKLGSISGLISLPYLVFQNLRKRPCFKLEFHGSSGAHYDNNGAHFYRYSYTGILKNQSLDPNTVNRFYLAVWKNKSKTSALRFGHGGIRITDKSTDKEVKLPIPFAPREARHVNIVFEFPVKGTADERLLKQHEEAKPGSGLYLAKYEYEICIEDVTENLFDSDGKQINREEIGLRWTFPNSIRKLKQRRVAPVIKHFCQIVFSNVRFRTKLLAQTLGLWK